jgi:hypothetical protein
LGSLQSENEFWLSLGHDVAFCVTPSDEERNNIQKARGSAMLIVVPLANKKPEQKCGVFAR